MNDLPSGVGGRALRARPTLEQASGGAGLCWVKNRFGHRSHVSVLVVDMIMFMEY